MINPGGGKFGAKPMSFAPPPNPNVKPNQSFVPAPAPQIGASGPGAGLQPKPINPA